jgi:hypothetical protein
MLAAMLAINAQQPRTGAIVPSLCTNPKDSVMCTTATPTTVKVVDSNGRISLGKQYAGRQVLVEEQEPGVWLVRTATVVPDNERWLLQPEPAADLERALDWASAHPADDRDADRVLNRLAEDAA